MGSELVLIRLQPCVNRFTIASLLTDSKLAVIGGRQGACNTQHSLGIWLPF